MKSPRNLALTPEALSHYFMLAPPTHNCAMHDHAGTIILRGTTPEFRTHLTSGFKDRLSQAVRQGGWEFCPSCLRYVPNPSAPNFMPLPNLTEFPVELLRKRGRPRCIPIRGTYPDTPAWCPAAALRDTRQLTPEQQQSEAGASAQLFK